jgi:Tfp pilus assembly protein PilE
MLVVAVTGIFVAMSVPSFQRSLEQSKADIAAANLRAIWSAERLYWLEYRAYTDDLSELESLDLVDQTIALAADPYRYEIRAADARSFSVVAVRSGSGKWYGQLVIDETGTVQGEIGGGGNPIQPGFL